MTDPSTALGFSVIAAYLGKDGIQKLLGPTADYLGQGLRDLAKKRIETVGRIFKNAESKLGEKIETPGEVSPKVLKAIIDEGSYSNDSLAEEYLGGILASSRSENGRDDRGARLAKLLDSMSNYQIRTHYLIYATISTLFNGKDLRISRPDDRVNMQIFIPLASYITAMDFSSSELDKINIMLSHIFFGLHRDDLLCEDFQYGPKEYLESICKNVEEHGIVCSPTFSGSELFLWAFGYSDKSDKYIFDPAFSPTVKGLPSFISGARPTKFDLIA